MKVNIADVYAVNFIGWGLVHESALASLEKSRIDRSSEVIHVSKLMQLNLLPFFFHFYLITVLYLLHMVFSLHFNRCTGLLSMLSTNQRLNHLFGPHQTTPLVIRIQRFVCLG